MSALNLILLGSSLLNHLRQSIDAIEIHNHNLAELLCKIIPAQCPFERNIQLFHRTLWHIPPLCKFNPLYEQLVGLRYRSLSYLADVCGEDVTHYCQ